ncbi:MAG: sporulation integral membrane protein YtvI [Bacillaceae bacterium]|nr:sporulation integral membrane protein YtvI [Bacillaceae bacterium]
MFISITAAICLLVYFVLSIAYPFAIGLAIAFLLNPMINWIQETFKIPRWIAVSTILLLVTTALIAILTFVISEIIVGTHYLSQSVPKHFQRFMEIIEATFTESIIPIYEHFVAIIYSLDDSHQTTIFNYSKTISTNISARAGDTIQSLLLSISNLLLSLPNLATVIIFSILATFFICKDWYKLVYYYRLWTPNTFAERTKEVMQSLKQAFLGYLIAQLTLISMTCCIVLIGLLFIKADYPITVALIIAVVDLLPYVGTGLIFVPWILYSFFMGQMSLTIGLSVLYAIVLIQRQIMEPKVLSKNIGVDPLATLFALFVGYKLLGFIGLMIGPVILVFIQTLYQARVFHDLKTYILK